MSWFGSVVRCIFGLSHCEKAISGPKSEDVDMIKFKVAFSGERNNTVDRSEFIEKEPETVTNTKGEAESTLECTDDTWGSRPEHFRYVRKIGEDGGFIPMTDGAGGEILTAKGEVKYEKELRLIGQPHIRWDGCRCLVRTGKDTCTWYKHFQVACILILQGKLDQSDMEWFKEEAKERVQKAAPTEVQLKALIKAGILIRRGNEAILCDEKEAAQALSDTQEIALTEAPKVEAE